MNPRLFIRGLFLIATLTVLGYLVKATELGGILDTGWIDSEVRDKGLVGLALFVAAGAVFTGVGLPRQILSFLGGYAFGFVAGTGLALVATVVGCIGAFAYSRLLGRDLVLGRLSTRIRKVDDFLSDNPFSMTLLIRLLPAGSNLVVNLAAGVTTIGALPFLAGSAIGYIPQTLVFALAGSGVNIEPSLRISLSVILFIASAMLGVSLYRRYRHGKTFDEGIEAVLSGEKASPRPAPSERDAPG